MIQCHLMKWIGLKENFQCIEFNELHFIVWKSMLFNGIEYCIEFQLNWTISKPNVKIQIYNSLKSHVFEWSGISIELYGN
jgi:hypothetical protein